MNINTKAGIISAIIVISLFSLLFGIFIFPTMGYIFIYMIIAVYVCIIACILYSAIREELTKILKRK